MKNFTRLLAVLLVGLAALIVGGTTTYIPGVSSLTSSATISSASARFLCATKLIRGGGLNVDGRYDWTCANWNWSSEYGGSETVSSAVVSDWDAPTTSLGNAYRLTCTGPGEGVTQDGTALAVDDDLALLGGTITAGSSTTVINDVGAGYAVNALRGYHIFILTGAQAGAQRQIVSNTADSITIGTNSALGGGPAAGDTYAVYNQFLKNCYADGEVVVLNPMADIMIAHQLTVDGGTIYAGNEGTATMFVDTGCGRKAMGSGTTAFIGNNCPILDGHNNNHYQRYIEMGFRGVTLDLGPRDVDRFNEVSLAGREGVYVVQDTGRGNDGGNATEGYDAADGAFLNNARPIMIGATTNGSGNRCTPVSEDDPRCDVTQVSSTAIQSYSYVMDARSFTAGVAAHNTDVTSPALFCVTSAVGANPNEGVCEDDPRIVCTSAGDTARTSATAGGCIFDDGGAGEVDLGPCVSVVDALDAWNDERPDRGPQTLAMNQQVQQFPGATYQTSREMSWGRIGSVPNAGCGAGGTAGGTVSMDTTADAAQWTLPISRFDTTSQPQIGWMHPDWNAMGGGIRGGTFMPSGWWGLDINGDTTSDPGDCLSGGDNDYTDDESACTIKSPISFGNIREAGIYDTLVLLCSFDVSAGAGSCVDSTDYAHRLKLENTIITRGKRGRIGDWTCVETDDVLIEDNNAGNAGGEGTVLSAGFNSRCREMGNITFRQNVGDFILNTPTWARHARVFHLTFEGNRSFRSQISIGAGGSWEIEDIHFNGGSQPAISLTNVFTNPIDNVSIRNIRGYGFSNTASNVNTRGARALIDFTRFSSSDIAADMRAFRIHDAWFEAGFNNAVLVAFDDHTGVAASDINTMRSSVTISESGIDCVDGATGCLAIAVGDHSLNFSASNDTGMLNEQYVPTWRSVYENGVMIPDQPWPQTNVAGPHGTNASLARCGDCDLAANAGRVCHIHDDTTANLCDDSSGGANGVLDGGGSARSICVCQGSTTNWVSLGD